MLYLEWRVSYSKKYISNNYILEKQLTGQGILNYNYSYGKLDNTKMINNIKTVFSYFWADLSSLFKIKYSYVSIGADQLFSGNVYKTYNYWNSINGSADIMFFDNLQIKYGLNLDFIKSSFRWVKSQSRNFSHELEVIFYTNKKIYYWVEAEYYDFLDFSQSKGKTFFLNAYFNMKLANSRYVLDIACKNLLNSDSFDVYGMDQNMITYSTVLLRPCSFILTLKMPLTHLNEK